MFCSLQPHGLQPARLLCLWNSPARILEWVASSYSRGSSWPRNRTWVSCISCIADRFFTAETLGKPHSHSVRPFNIFLAAQTFWPQSFFSPCPHNVFFFLIGIYLLYNVVLVYAFQHHKSAISIHLLTSLLSLPPSPQTYPSSSSQRTELSSLCYTAASH